MAILNIPTNEYNKQVFTLHLEVLKELIRGKSFSTIQSEFADEMVELNYEHVAKRGLLAFNGDNELIGAYPISPIKTKYQVTIEGLGTAYSMCAIDALGVAYTFEAKTTIDTVDSSTGKSITIVIDPFKDKQDPQDFVISYQRKVDKNVATAVSLCPTIHFYSDKMSIEEDSGIEILSFDDALKSAKNQFSQEAMQACVTRGVEKSLGLPLSSSCCTDNRSQNSSG